MGAMTDMEQASGRSLMTDTYNRIVRDAPFGIYVVDADFCLAEFSEGCAKVFANIDPLIGRDFEEILHILWEEPFASECIGQFRETMRTGEAYRASDTSKPRSNVEDEESYDWKVERVTLPDGGYGVVCYFYDLTERIHLTEALSNSERELREARDELETRVGERTAELVDAHSELVRLLTEVVAVQETERQRISRDVHDHLGGTLTGLRLNLESLLADAKDQPKLLRRIENIQKIALGLDADISYLAWMLRPAILDDRGLVPALDSFVREWSERFSIGAEFKAVNVGDLGLERDVETNLYRIAQEALTNCAKHASAGSVTVILEQRPDSLRLIVEDDGVGLPHLSAKQKAPADAKHGLGLGGMRDRATLIGASFEIESSPGSGTAIFVSIPA